MQNQQENNAVQQIPDNSQFKIPNAKQRSNQNQTDQSSLSLKQYQQQQQQDSAQKKIFQLQHKQYYCPIYHEKGTKSKIIVSNLQQLINSSPKLIIPVFQRYYCWEKKQIQQWIIDIEKQQNHRIGQIHIVKLENKLIILDGQQRLTTTIIFLTVLRDIVIKLLKNVEQSQNKNAFSEQNNNQKMMTEIEENSSEFKKKYQEILEKTIMKDKVEKQQTGQIEIESNSIQIQSIQQEQRETDQLFQLLVDIDLLIFNNTEFIYKEEENNKLSEQLQQGKVFKNSKLIPCYPDRQIFFKIITNPYLSQETKDFEINLSMKIDQNGDSVENLNIQQMAYNHFYKEITQKLKNKSLKQNLEALYIYFESSTQKMQIIISEVYDIKCGQQLYLWLQEPKAGWFMHNPAPGINFNSIQFLKNLFLSYFFQDDELSLDIYLQYWLPIEQKLVMQNDQSFVKQNVRFDEKIMKFLIKQNQVFIKKMVQIQKKYVNNVIARLGPGIVERMISLDIYYLFVEYFEQQKEISMNDQLQKNQQISEEKLFQNFVIEIMICLGNFLEQN